MKKQEEYEGYYADCYVLSKNRTENFINDFLNTYVPNRIDPDDRFEESQYPEDPTKGFKTSGELINFLTQNKSVKHTIYWQHPHKSGLRGVELFFTDDECVIFGIYCETKYPNTEIEDEHFRQLKDFCQSNEGYITYEDTPPHNSEEFRNILKEKK